MKMIIIDQTGQARNGRAESADIGTKEKLSCPGGKAGGQEAPQALLLMNWLARSGVRYSLSGQQTAQQAVHRADAGKVAGKDEEMRQRSEAAESRP